MITQLVNSDPAEYGDDVLTTQEYEEADWKVLKRMAAESDCEEIDYMSTRLEVRAYYARQRTLEDYE
jgi:hypothetical protein